MKATQVFIVLTLATAVCAAIGVGFYFNYSDELPEDAQRVVGESLAMATPEDSFGPVESPDPGAPALPASDLEDTSMTVIESVPETTGVETEPRVVGDADLQAARVALTQKDHEAVLAALGDSGPVEGNAFDVHYLRSLSLRHVGRHEDAVREMDAALELQPDNVRALVNSARALLPLERGSEAALRAQRAVELAPEDSDAWNVLGRAQLALSDVAAATEAFQRATELDPNNAHAFNNTGYALIQQQQWQAAADALETAIALRDDVAWFFNNLGVAYEKLDRPMEAAAAWHRALELQPEYDKVQVSLARITPRVQAIEEQLAEAALVPGIEPGVETGTVAGDVEGEETKREELSNPSRDDVVDEDGTEAGSDSRSEQSGSGATEETPEGSISPQ